MKSASFPFLFLSFLLLAGCGGQDSTGASTSPKKVGTSCLAAYETRIGDLLPLEMLSEAVDLEGITPEVDVVNTERIKNVAWSWPGSRTREMDLAGQRMTLPVDNQIVLSGYKRLDNNEHGPKDAATYVAQTYRSISKEQMAALQARMKEQLQEQAARGEITEEQARLAGGMGGGIMGNERIVETVEGVGDAARWTPRDRTLAVGHRNVVFTLLVDISEDQDLNRSTAVSLAQAILNLCD
jgi:hypothetical protein